MKKIILMLILTVMLTSFSLSTKVNASNENRFVAVEVTQFYLIMVDKETRVMYVVSSGTYKTFTVMVDEYGKPLLWEGELE